MYEQPIKYIVPATALPIKTFETFPSGENSHVVIQWFIYAFAIWLK